MLAPPPQDPSFPVQRRRDPALDGLRGVAILLVFFFHYGGGLRSSHWAVRAFGYVAQAGWAGVELFFALSGFLITGILLDSVGSPHQLRRFFARRARRILPLYLFALLLCGGAALANGARLSQLRPLLIYASFLQNLPPLVQPALHTPPPLPVFHLWSLAVEEQFYLVWPALLLWARTPRRSLAACLWIFGASCAVRLAIFSPSWLSDATQQHLATFLPVRAGALALGGALACATRLRPEARIPNVVRWAGAGATIILVVYSAAERTLRLERPDSYVVALPALEVLCVVAVALSLQWPLFRSALATRSLGALGRVSYGLYVFHILLEPLFDRLGASLTGATSGFTYQGVRLVVAFCLSTAVALASYRWLERPFLHTGPPDRC